MREPVIWGPGRLARVAWPFTPLWDVGWQGHVRQVGRP